MHSKMKHKSFVKHTNGFLSHVVKCYYGESSVSVELNGEFEFFLFQISIIEANLV